MLTIKAKLIIMLFGARVLAVISYFFEVANIFGITILLLLQNSIIET